MDFSLVLPAISHFGLSTGHAEITALGNGLINNTYKVTIKEPGVRHFVFQLINTAVFPAPEDIQYNYCLIRDYLLQKGSSIRLPDPLFTPSGTPWWRDEAGRFWRGFSFIENSYSPDTASNPALAFTAARCFGRFTHEFNGMDISRLKEILPRFHDLGWRFEQFSEALSEGNKERIAETRALTDALISRTYILDFFREMTSNPAFRLRVMHHDTKVSNILFDRTTEEIICPVDMDTVMPGYFYSDLGDMIRTMTCSVSENNTDFNSIQIREDYYQSILEGYMSEMDQSLTNEEKQHIHFAGLIMIYQQALRFITDYLLGDVYYKTQYPGHNADRAKNQLFLLASLEKFLVAKYRFQVPSLPTAI